MLFRSAPRLCLPISVSEYHRQFFFCSFSFGTPRFHSRCLYYTPNDKFYNVFPTIGVIFFRRLAYYFSDDWRNVFPMIGISLLYITKSGQSRYSRQAFCSCAALCSIPLRSISHAGIRPFSALRSALTRFRFAPSRTRASALCVKGESLRNSCKHDSGGSLLLRALLIAYAIISRSSTSGRSL